MMSIEDATRAVEQFVMERDHVSFIEIERKLDDLGFPRKGDLSYQAEPNLILWSGMSEQFCDVVDLLFNRKAVVPEPTEYLTYLIDGGGLSLPLARRIPDGGYKKPRWLPVCWVERERL